MNSVSGELSVGADVAGSPSLASAQQGQGVAALLVMLAVLCFIFAYCFWGAPFCRSFCRKHCCCRLEDPEGDARFGSTDQTMVATPTIILLPHGRMLVVDGTIFTQFQADTTGLDLVQLGENVIQAHRNPRVANRHQLQNSQGSILEMDAETPSKDSLGSVGCFPPPTYESIYGKEETEMPPSYSDILLHRFANLPYDMDVNHFCCDGKEEIEMQSLENCSRIINNPLHALHPYATITSFPSQSVPRRNISRNSSIISNPLDNYYVDNESEMYRLRRDAVPRVFSNNAISASLNFRNNNNHNTSTTTNNNNNNNNEHNRTDSSNDNNNDGIRLSSSAEDDGEKQEGRSIVTSAASENEIMNSRNHDRSSGNYGNLLYRVPDRSVVYDRRSNYVEIVNVGREERQDGNGSNSGESAVRAQRAEEMERNENRNSQRRSSLHRSLESDNIYPEDDDADNFGALADIRESRV